KADGADSGSKAGGEFDAQGQSIRGGFPRLEPGEFPISEYVLLEKSKDDGNGMGVLADIDALPREQNIQSHANAEPSNVLGLANPPVGTRVNGLMMGNGISKAPSLPPHIPPYFPPFPGKGDERILRELMSQGRKKRTLAETADGSRSARDDAEPGRSSTTKRRRVNPYKQVLPYSESKFAGAADLLQPPPTDDIPPSPSSSKAIRETFMSRELYALALSAAKQRPMRTSKKDDLTPLPRSSALRLLQQRRRVCEACPGDSIFGVTGEKGLLDDMAEIALPKLKGFLGVDDQPPPPPLPQLPIPTPVAAVANISSTPPPAPAKRKSTVVKIDKDSSKMPPPAPPAAASRRSSSIVSFAEPHSIPPSRRASSIPPPAEAPKIKLRLSISNAGEASAPAATPSAKNNYTNNNTTTVNSTVHQHRSPSPLLPASPLPPAPPRPPPAAAAAKPVALPQPVVVHHEVYTDSDITNCVCETPTLDDGGFMIACDKCGVWFHGRCVGIPHEGMQIGDWFCPRCVGSGVAV
ncbi:hypothetical protein HK104_010862, partial [Borealophlyctis nickersoniae]